MKHAWVLYITVGIKTSLFLTLFFSMFFVFPQFLWKTNTQPEEVNTAIRNKESLEEYNDKGATPLIGAASQGKIDVVNQLLDAGAKIEAHAQNADDQWIEAGNTALHYACLNGQVDVVKLLIKRGALPYSLNDNKNTPLYTVIYNVDMPISDQEECIRTLVGTDPKMIRVQFNMQNKQGYTPLMRAVELRNAALVELLIKNWGQFIDYKLQNEDGNTAYGIALSDAADDTIKRMVKDAQDQWSLKK